ncbi:MAG: hypothetical protein QM706_11970 [Nitrospira sp.]
MDRRNFMATAGATVVAGVGLLQAKGLAAIAVTKPQKIEPVLKPMFHERLIEARLAKGLTVREAAKLTTQGMLCLWEEERQFRFSRGEKLFPRLRKRPFFSIKYWKELENWGLPLGRPFTDIAIAALVLDVSYFWLIDWRFNSSGISDRKGKSPPRKRTPASDGFIENWIGYVTADEIRDAIGYPRLA